MHRSGLVTAKACSSFEIEVMFAAAWPGLLVALVLICLNSWGLEFACLFPGWQSAVRVSSGTNSTRLILLISSMENASVVASVTNERPFGIFAGDGSSFPLQSHLSTNPRNRIKGWLPLSSHPAMRHHQADLLRAVSRMRRSRLPTIRSSPGCKVMEIICN
jgi:hypothetical protein